MKHFAATEYEEAARYYSARQRGLDGRFIASVENAISLLCEAPECWRVFASRAVRRAFTRVFPYSILYPLSQTMCSSWPLLTTAANRATGNTAGRRAIVLPSMAMFNPDEAKLRGQARSQAGAWERGKMSKHDLPHLRILIALLLLVPQFAFGQADTSKLPRIVDNSASAFIREWNPSGNVLEIHADFDQDGIEDLAYGDRNSFGHRGNGSWDIFLRRHDGKYVEVGTIEYRSHLRITRGKKGEAIVKTYIPGGVIISYRISKRGLKEIRRENIALDYNGFRIDQTFGSDPPELPYKAYTNDEFKAKGGV